MSNTLDITYRGTARKSIPFEMHILQKTRSILAPDPTLWDRWPPEQGYLT